jgi:tellurite resistance protein TehA-like permease
MWLLPAIWLICIIALDVSLLGMTGDRRMVIVIAGFAGLWLTSLSGHASPPIVDSVLLGTGGVLVMALVGFFQDALRVPRRVCLFYPTMAVAALIVLAGIDDLLGPNLFVYMCMSLYLVSTASCLVCVGRSFIFRHHKHR